MTPNSYEQALKKQEQLKAELAAAQQRLAETRQVLEAQRQQLRSQYGEAMLALVEGDPRTKIVITNVMEKLVFIDERGHTLSQTDEIFREQRVEVKLVEDESTPPE